MFCEPTAQTSPAEAADTALSFSSKRTMFGVGVCDQAVPFQCSASMTPPSSSFGPGKTPTAQASVGVRAKTAFKGPSAGLAIGVITQAGAAKAGAASARAAPAAGTATAARRRNRLFMIDIPLQSRVEAVVGAEAPALLVTLTVTV